MLAPVTYAFNGHQGLVIVYARLTGPRGTEQARLAVDTGSAFTVIRKSRLSAVGYLTTSYPQNNPLQTANGIVMAALIEVGKFECFAHERFDFPIAVHDVSPNPRLDGVLGLDFLRGHFLEIDFPNGEIRLK